MVRISHAAAYFMPLFCYSRPYVVVLACFVTVVVFAAVYASSLLLGRQYGDPGLFKPNSQDYFRTSLLGMFSPILYYFVKTFLFNVNRRYVVVNLVIDFALNDWFILFIIVCLAYPQQEQSNKGEYADVWHIIPRQSYMFGIAWSLGEFIICVTGNLFNYQQVATGEGVRGSGGDVENMANHDLEPQDSLRENITLAKCVGVRRNSSNISHNVYCSEFDLFKDYGSTRKTARPFDDTVVMVDPSDNSLRLGSSELDNGLSIDGSGSRERRRIETAGDNPTMTRKFLPFQNNRELSQALLLLGLVLTSNILSMIGESMIFSIFFIYVPHHDSCFTRIVNYFGTKSFNFFLVTVLLPFILVNLFVNTLIFFWNDMEEWNNRSSETPPSSSHILARDYIDFYDSDISLQRSRPGSMGFPESNIGIEPTDPTPFMLMTSPAELHYYNNVSTGNYDSGPLRVLAIMKNVLNAWRSVARKSSFVLPIMSLWAVLLFSIGLSCTVFI